MKKAVTVMLLLLVLCAGSALCADQGTLETVRQLEVVKTLLVPDKTPMSEARDLGSLYEIVLDQSGRKIILYVTKDGKYLVQGNLFDAKGVNLFRERSDELNKIDVTKIPYDDAIVIKKGEGGKKLVLVTDVDCPYCKQAYGWLQEQKDVSYTLYVLLMPLDQLHPQAREKSIKVLCSKDPVEALTLAKTNKEIPAEKCAAGEARLKKHTDYATSIGVTGTPLFIFDTGAKMPGFNPQGLAEYLKQK